MFKNLIKELKEFILKGNMIDMAIGIIIGASFSKVIDSLVKDIIMPPIGMLLGKVDFTNLYFQIYPYNKHYETLKLAQESGAVTINYGIFLNTFISFTIVAITVFFIIKSINKFKNKLCKNQKIEKEITQKDCPYCLSTIPIKATRCPYCTSNLN